MFAWRSILFGRELLQKGLKWQIGNGRNTRVWLDKWVQDPEVGMRTPWIKNITFDEPKDTAAGFYGGEKSLALGFMVFMEE